MATTARNGAPPRGAVIQRITGVVSRVNRHGFQLAEYPDRWFNPSQFAENLELPTVKEAVDVGMDSRGFVREIRVLSARSNGNRSWNYLPSAGTALDNPPPYHAQYDGEDYEYDEEEPEEETSTEPGIPWRVQFKSRVDLIAAAAALCAAMDGYTDKDVVKFASAWERWCLGETDELAS